MGPTIECLNKGELDYLRPEVDGSIVYTRGRVDNLLQFLLGSNKLPILVRNTRLATLIMWESQNEDHRSDPSDVLTRSRQRA